VSEALVAGLLAGYGIAVPVGPITILIANLAARSSWRVGAGAALGVGSADGLYALAAALGGTALVGLVEPVATPLRWLAALILLGLAARTGLTAVRGYRDPVAAARVRPGLGTPIRAYLGLLGLTLLNPMTIVHFGALVLGRQAADGLSAGGELVFVAAALTASTSWQLLVAGGGRLVGRLLTGPRGRLATALAASAVIAALAVYLLA
jgi:arginine exporter protein ArgO